MLLRARLINAGGKTMLYAIVCILFACGLVTTLRPSKAETPQIELSAALFDGCPFICLDETGPFVEGLKAAFAGTRYQLKFKHVPFARATRELQSGKLDLLPGMLKDGLDDAVYPESWLYFTRMCFFSKVSDPWRWRGINSLNGRTIAVENDIIHTQEFSDFVQDNPLVTHLSGGDILKRQLQMLELGRIQSFTAEQTVLAYHLKQNNIAPDSVQNSGCFPPEFEYVAINASHPMAADIREVLTRGLTEYNKTFAVKLN